MNIKQFIKERDEALLSLDKEKITKFAKKHGVPIPKDETAFWAGVHKAIWNLNSANAEQKLNSMMWLTNHGFSPDIYGGKDNDKTPKMPVL